MTQPISRTTPAAVGLWDREQSRRHVPDLSTYQAATSDALCLACRERIENREWLAGVCPGPKTTKETT